MSAKNKGKSKLCLNDMQKLQDNIVEALKTEMKDLREMLSKIQTENIELKNTVKECKQENVQMKVELTSLQDKYNDLEQYSRRNSLRIFGLCEREEETPSRCEENVINLIKEKLNVSVESNDIDVIHRTGRRYTNQTKPRGIIVKFVQRSKKDTILHKRRQLKGTGITITEDLTTANLNTLKEIRDRPNVSNAWTVNGKIFCVGNDGKKRRVNQDLSFTDIPVERTERRYNNNFKITSTPTNNNNRIESSFNSNHFSSFRRDMSMMSQPIHQSTSEERAQTSMNDPSTSAAVSQPSTSNIARREQRKTGITGVTGGRR